MTQGKIRGGAAPVTMRLRRAVLLAATVAAGAAAARAEEFRLFPQEAARPRFYTSSVWGTGPERRLLDLDGSYPWDGGAAFPIQSDDTEASSGGSDEPPPPPPPEQPSPPKKLFTKGTTLWTVAALLGGVGQGIGAPIKYGTQSWHFTDEGYFGYDTYAGGADKASHFVISSGVSRLLFEAYKAQGLTVDQSFNLSLAVTLIDGILVETGDAVTVYGWSWQDLTADFLGATAGLFIHRYGLRDLIGLRVGSTFNDIPAWAVGSSQESLGSSYNDEIFTADLRLGGLITRLHGKPGIARFFLTSFVYYTRGFGYQPPLPSRYQECGVELGIDFPAILKAVNVPEDKWWGQGLYAFFSFFRIPFTQIGVYYNFKNKKWYGPSAPYHYY